jgi:hypothetical protein
MSPRQQVDQQRIEYFLQQLGRQFTKPGRVYLVGGTSIVYFQKSWGLRLQDPADGLFHPFRGGDE